MFQLKICQKLEGFLTAELDLGMIIVWSLLNTIYKISCFNIYSFHFETTLSQLSLLCKHSATYSFKYLLPIFNYIFINTFMTFIFKL